MPRSEVSTRMSRLADGSTVGSVPSLSAAETRAAIAAARLMAVVVLPSPSGVGVMAVTSM